MKILKIFLFFLCIFDLYGQSIINSVRIEDNIQSADLSGFGSKVALVGHNPFPLPGSNNNEFPIYFIDGDLNPYSAYKVSYRDYNFSNTTIRTKFKDSLLITVFGLDHTEEPNLKGVSIFNVNTGKANSYSKFGLGDESVIEVNQENILILMSLDGELNLDCISKQGFQNWNKNLTFFSTPTQLYLNAGIALKNGSFLFSVSFRNEQNEYDSIIFELSESGEIINIKKLQDIEIYNIHEKENGNFIFVGRTTKMTKFTMNTTDAFILESSSDYKIKESKLVFGEYFSCSKIVSKYFSSNDVLIISNSTSFNFPTILATLNSDYNIEGQTGFDFIQPETIIFDNETMLVFSLDINTGKRLIDEIDMESEVYSSCTSVESCLQIEDFNIEFIDQEYQLEESTSMDILSMDYIEFSFNLEDIECRKSFFPESRFLAKDTFCINSCDTIYSINQTTNHKRQWSIKGPGIDSLIYDSLSFYLCFNEAGEYKLNQTIWYLGCPINYEKKIVVLENLEITLNKEGVVCNEPPIEITALTNRPLNSLIWNNIIEDEYLEVFSSGTYSLIAEDGYCLAQKDFEITFIDDLVSVENVLLSLSDTTLCEQHFPYKLIVKSEVGAKLFIDGIQIVDDEVVLNYPGSYCISSEYFGCEFKKEFNIQSNECLSQIYIPNTFSPNGDGINDEIKPLGKYFEPINFSVYNRWGVLVYSGSTAWDGSYSNSILQPDIYFYSFSYLNTLSEEVEFTKGEFLLIY